jgi:hypothetical protein
VLLSSNFFKIRTAVLPIYQFSQTEYAFPLSILIFERLNRFLQSVRYLPITMTDLNLAATLWADARRRGQKTEDDRDLGGDPILAAQVRSLFSPWANVVLVTENRKHLTRYGIDARSFQEIGFPEMES